MSVLAIPNRNNYNNKITNNRYFSSTRGRGLHLKDEAFQDTSWNTLFSYFSSVSLKLVEGYTKKRNVCKYLIRRYLLNILITSKQ